MPGNFDRHHLLPRPRVDWVVEHDHNVPNVSTRSDQAPISPEFARLRAEALACTGCALWKTRKHVVFGEGNPSADLVIVGEAPGGDEDSSGRPFSGWCGRRLTDLLRMIGLDRADVYITNVVLCRPPGNRRPRLASRTVCAPYLDAQLRLVRPRVAIALGVTATRRLLGGQTTVTAARGREHRVGDAIIIPTFHPAALNRRPERRQQAHDDFRLARRALDGKLPAG
jgi:DNA polymerase